MLFLFACGPSRLSQQDFSKQLASPDNLLQPEFTIYHSQDSSFLYFAMPANDLMYKLSADTFRAILAVRYQMHATFESPAILDSATYTFSIIQDSMNTYLRGWFPFRPPPQGKAVLKISFTDVNLKQGVERLKVVNRTPSGLQQQFVVTDTSGIPLVRNYIAPGEVFRVKSQIFGNSPLLVRCYFHRYPLPAPPFSKAPDPAFSFKADSIFNYRESSVLQLDRPGIYHFQTDTARKTGFTVFVFDPWFPEIKSPAQLIEPLRYLTMKKEYDEMKDDPDPKHAAEAFWLKTGGRNDRSKALIRIYYQRIQEANRQFTSYLPGWKTDRGMIYAIMGPPNSVYRSETTEQWTYSTENSGSVVLDFKLVGNPFTDKDYSLIRREDLDYPWYQSVERWREGNISLRH